MIDLCRPVGRSKLLVFGRRTNYLNMYENLGKHMMETLVKGMRSLRTHKFRRVSILTKKKTKTKKKKKTTFYSKNCKISQVHSYNGL